MHLLEPIQLPSRASLETVADMAALLLADEKAIRLKNADLEALAGYFRQRSQLRQ